MSEIRYRAFLSYSHRDRRFAEWLHHELETYRVPQRMVGNETEAGPVPARLHPIFKDREELSASGSLGEAITAALSRASALIVVCSPSAAVSPWVNEEVRTFKQMHGPSRVFAVIAEGEPGHSEMECFPPALRFTVGDDGQVTDIAAEPIAADFRPEGDGKRIGKLKVVAGLIGVGLDQLVQRETQRRQRRLRYVAAASLAGMTVTSGLAVAAVVARNEAQQQRVEADGLVEFMLTDLRKKLEPVGRLDVLDTVGRRALTYYSHQDPSKLDADALGRRARALQLVAEVRNLRGDSEGALAAFKQAAATTGELLARQPNDGQRIFDHSQSVFWVGSIAWQRGDQKTAQENFLEYLKQAKGLVRLDPHNDAWAAELGYANQNLGILYLDQGRVDEALTYFDNTEVVWKNLAKRAADKREPSYFLAQAVAWKADARHQKLDLAGAVNERSREYRLYQAMLVVDPNDSKAKEGLSVAQFRSAQLQMEAGAVDQATVLSAQSFATIRKLLEQDQSNRLWQEIAIKAANIRAEALMMAGDRAGAREVNAWALENATRLVARDRTVTDWRTDCLLPARWMQIALSDGATARQQIAAFNSEFDWNPTGKPTPEERFAWIAVDMLDGANWRATGQHSKARTSFTRAAGRFPTANLTDARLLAVASYLSRSEKVSGLPQVAPTLAGRVRYDVGALLGSRKE
jgi:tetratricopeptide (TPR) repeat protein